MPDEPEPQWCDEHWQQVLADEDANPMVAAMALTDTLLNDTFFYEVAYRCKNGYGLPEGVDPEVDDIPEGERPGTVHINQALQELSPLCCFLEDERDEFTTVLEKARGERPMVADEVRVE